MATDPTLPPPPTERLQTLLRMQSERFSRTFLLVALVLVGVIFFNMVKIFILPVLLAAVFTTLFNPLYLWLIRILGNRQSLSAFLCCMVLLLGLLVPVYFLVDLVSSEAISFYPKVQQKIQQLISSSDQGSLGRLRESPWFRRFYLDKIDWPSAIQELAQRGGGLTAKVISKTSGGAFHVITNIFVTLFIMFYFFRDGAQLVTGLKYLIPMDDKHKDALISRFAAVSRASIKGTILIGFLQSTVGAITLWIFGVSSPALWGVVMLILSVIPLLGAWLVMHTAALIQILLGNVWQGIGIFLITVLIISSIDNVLRPRLVGKYTGMHDLLIFFSAIGGISTFGVMGFIVGPVIAALFVTILEIYSIEFKQQLDLAQSSVPQPPQP